MVSEYSKVIISNLFKILKILKGILIIDLKNLL